MKGSQAKMALLLFLASSPMSGPHEKNNTTENTS